MAFLLFVGILSLYLFTTIGVFVFAVKVAKARRSNGWLWGILSLFLMYNLVFWDWIPTIAAYHYYDKYEAGIWINKTPAQWTSENRGAAHSLKDAPATDMERYPNGYTFHLNQRIDSENTESFPWPKIRRFETRLVDRKTHEILVREVRFTSGDCRNGLPIKFWLQNCRPINRIGNIQTEFKNIGTKQ